MAGPKGQGYVKKAEKKKATSTQAATEKEQGDAKRAERRNFVELLRQAKKKPLVLVLRTGADGGHHCPQKDRGVSHRTTPACITKGHMGACPKCCKPVPARKGCYDCNSKGKDLRFHNVIFPHHAQAKGLQQPSRYDDGVLPFDPKKKKGKRG